MVAKLTRGAMLAAAIAAIGLVGGCAKVRDHKGYIVDSGLIDSVQPGIDNRDSVAKTLGRPSFAGQFDGDSHWYYVARDVRSYAYSNPKPVAQTLLTVNFDKAGNVVSVQKTGLETVASISADGHKTPTLGRDRGFFAELFGNIGRVGGAGGGGAGGGSTDNPN